MTSTAVGPAAASTSPTTAARRGTRSLGTASPQRTTRSARSPSPWRKATRIASMRSCRTRRRPACIVRTIAARPGSSSISRICRPSALPTTRGWPSHLTTKICSTSRRSPSRCRATAGRRCSRPRAVEVAARRPEGGGAVGEPVRAEAAAGGGAAASDGGPTISAPGGDNHDVWIDPTNANRVLVANDAGVAISDNRATSYRHFLLPISQVYHVMADNAVPYNVMGNIQDKSSFRGPNRGGGGRGGMGVGNWVGTGGCEDAFAVPDPADPDIVWSGCDNGRIVRMDYKHGMARDVSPWPITSYGWAPADMKYRWDWITPMTISPHDHNRVYVGAQVVFMTTNAGQTWTVISPDLTTNDKSHQGNS